MISLLLMAPASLLPFFSLLIFISLAVSDLSWGPLNLHRIVRDLSFGAHSCCSTQAQKLPRTGLVAPGIWDLNSLTRD